tara:strand:+ start:2950 stop:4722 length:1773 start_codon:yes stop_codon:yes gene_type:complete
MNARKKAVTKKTRKKMTAEQKAEARAIAKKKREEAKFRASTKEIFTGSGFKFIPSEGKEFTLKTQDGSRTTELDGIFVYENVIVVVEDTCTASPGQHLAGKQIIFGLAINNKIDFIDCLKDKISAFNEYLQGKNYELEDYVLRVLYFSMNSVDSEYVESASRVGIQVVERSLTNYFHSLVKNISVSAKYEMLKFMKVSYSELGAARLSGGNTGSISSYNGFLLPEANSSYPTGYKVISFYVDPASLLKKSFVLRKNGWIAPNLSYQRILDMSKIKLMRRYLSESKRVYLGNIIATLPPTTKINDINSSNQLAKEQQSTVKPVNISLPDEYNVVGLIDGQHRVYSYHEGIDTFDPEIRKLRKKQNLLVTGIIYPEGTSEDDRILFEARLFLEINSKQTKVKSVLTQEIELIVNPFSVTAIAKAILIKLARKGALKDKLEEHVFDDAKKLKVSSIVSYGLKPLIKKDGGDSLFTAWTESQKKDEVLLQKNRECLEAYIDFCVDEINSLLNAVKISFPAGWNIGHENKILTPTAINGFLKCLRLIIENGDDRGLEFYKNHFCGISEFDFSKYKSSHWNQLGSDLYTQLFSKKN